MKSLTIKKLFNIHSWVGVITAVLLFIVAFSGAIAVLSRPELKIWANPEIQQAPKIPAQAITELVNQYHEQVPAPFGENIHVYLPSGHNTHLLTLLFESHHGDDNYDQAVAHVFQFHPNTLALQSTYYGPSQTFYAKRKTDAASFIGHFHADLHLGRPIGLILTGVLGLTLLVSTLTGLFIHRQFLRQLFTFRRHKGTSVWVSDGHKVMGIWGSLFHGVIGFTGAFLGLATVILLPAAALVNFGGDQDKLVETFTAIPEPVISHQYQPTQLADILADAEQRFADAHILDATIMAHNDANSEVYLRLLGGESVASQLLHYHGDGEYIKSMSSFGDIPGVSIKVLELLFPLHFGNFGGIFIKLVWTALGLTTALLPLSGIMMWLSKRARGNNPSLSHKAYQRWNRFIIGSCGGLVLACMLLFPAQVLINAYVPPTAHNAVIGPLFFYSWLLWLLLGALPWHYHRYFQATLACIGSLALLVLPLNVLLSENHVFNAGSLLVSSVDIGFFAIGLGCYYALRRLYKGAATQSQLVNQEQQV